MRIKKTERQFPILLGFPNGKNQLAVWCPYCYRWHYHGNVEGSRSAHCQNPYSPFKKSGYIVKRATEKDMKQINRDNLFEREYEDNSGLNR